MYVMCSIHVFILGEVVYTLFIYEGELTTPIIFILILMLYHFRERYIVIIKRGKYGSMCCVSNLEFNCAFEDDKGTKKHIYEHHQRRKRLKFI